MKYCAAAACVLGVVVSMACASHHAPVAAPASVATPVLVAAPASPAPVQPDNAEAAIVDAEITLDRGRCYGSCPDYVVVISGNGHVRWTGRKWVLANGGREESIALAEVGKLLDQIESAGFFDIHDMYNAPVSDLPTTTLTVRHGARTNSLKSNWSPRAWPPADRMSDLEKAHMTVGRLAAAIDTAVGSERWIGSPQGRAAAHDHRAPKFPDNTVMPK
jgi:hypothetical protein